MTGIVAPDAAMSLRRMPDFSWDRDPATVRAVPPVYVGRSLYTDYVHLGNNKAGWLGMRRQGGYQVVQVCYTSQLTISDFRTLLEIRHPNIAPMLGIYSNGHTTAVVHEQVDLDLFDIAPLLSEVDIASVIVQIFSAVTYLLSQPIDVRVTTVRVSLYGAVKLILDLSEKPSTDLCRRKAMYRFMVSYVEQVMTTMAADNSTWTYDAADFLDVLYSGQLPPITPFSASVEAPYLLAQVDFVGRMQNSGQDGMQQSWKTA